MKPTVLALCAMIIGGPGADYHGYDLRRIVTARFTISAADTEVYEARWPRSSLPVVVLIAPDAMMHEAAIIRAVIILNGACGCELYGQPIAAGWAAVMEFTRDGHGFRGTVLVRADGQLQPPRGHAEPVFTGRRRFWLYSVVVTLPAEPVPAWRMRQTALHELVHAAGMLAHSVDPGNVRHQHVLPGQRVTDIERRWLAREYRQ